MGEGGGGFYNQDFVPYPYFQCSLEPNFLSHYHARLSSHFSCETLSVDIRNSVMAKVNLLLVLMITVAVSMVTSKSLWKRSDVSLGNFNF